jgi:hypothetical protein
MSIVLRNLAATEFLHTRVKISFGIFNLAFDTGTGKPLYKVNPFQGKSLNKVTV